MQAKTVAIAGFGDLGTRLAARLPPARWRCIGLRRTASAVPAGVQGVAVDLNDPASLQVLERLAPDALVIALTPTERSPDGYRAGFANAMAGIVAGLGAHRPERALFVSSTRVYSEADGGTVDEASPVMGSDPHVAAILEAEERFLEGVSGGLVLRAGGLYGNGPGPLLKRVAAGGLTPATPLRYSNRVHRDDVAGFMAFSLETDLARHRINLVDNEPATMQDVEAWLCQQIGQSYDPPSGDEAPASGKRISNEQMRACGFKLRYPDFRAGYAAVLQGWPPPSERENSLDLH